jgi:hypothetical protein
VSASNFSVANVPAGSRVVSHTSRAKCLLRKNGGHLRSAIPSREASATAPTANSVMKAVSLNPAHLLISIAVLQVVHAMPFREASAPAAMHADTLTKLKEDSERPLHMEFSTLLTRVSHVVQVAVSAMRSREVNVTAVLLANLATVMPSPPLAIPEDRKQLVLASHFRAAPATAVKAVDFPTVMLELTIQPCFLVSRRPATLSRPVLASMEKLVSSRTTCLLWHLNVSLSRKLGVAVV